jgi:hypothetical protein
MSGQTASRGERRRAAAVRRCTPAVIITRRRSSSAASHSANHGGGASCGVSCGARVSRSPRRAVVSWLLRTMQSSSKLRLESSLPTRYCGSLPVWATFATNPDRTTAELPDGLPTHRGLRCGVGPGLNCTPCAVGVCNEKIGSGPVRFGAGPVRLGGGPTRDLSGGAGARASSTVAAVSARQKLRIPKSSRRAWKGFRPPSMAAL